jgi:hypothetical protein
MADWPSISDPAFDLYAQTLVKAQIKTEFENGKVQSRARATSARLVVSLGWHALSNTDYSSLQTFFTNNIGGTFNWTHPLTSTVYVMRFTSDALPGAKPSGYSADGTIAWELTGLELEQS